MKLLIRWAITALALFAAAWVVPGIHVDDSRGWVVYAAMAVILSLVNALIRPLLKVLTCPLIVLTLGLFTLVVNAVSMLIASAIANNLFKVGFYIDGVLARVLGRAHRERGQRGPEHLRRRRRPEGSPPLGLRSLLRRPRRVARIACQPASKCYDGAMRTSGAEL